MLVGNPSHSYHPGGFYPGARPPDIEQVHCVWQRCICPSQAAPLAQGGVLDGWRAGWARPDEGVWVDEGGVVHVDKPMRLGVVNGWWGWQPKLSGRGRDGGRCPPPPLEMGVKMFELAQTNLFTHPLAVRRQLLARAGLGGDGVCGEGLDVDADLVGGDGHGGFQPGGGEPRGVCRGGARHRLPAQARRNPRWGPPAAAQPQPPGCLRQGPGGHLPRPGPPRHGMLIAF